MDKKPSLGQCSPPIVAILRGVVPAEAGAIGSALVEAGIRIVEVPLNSPDALASIERLAASVGDGVMIGAGTVLHRNSVDDVADAGGQFIVAPNTDSSVIVRALERGLEAMPGALTPTEVFAAIAAGARDVKIFPAGTAGAPHIRALREVLPPDCRLWAVGGVSVANLPAWIECGAFGVGIGSALYRSGRSVDDVKKRAAELVAKWRLI